MSGTTDPERSGSQAPASGEQERTLDPRIVLVWRATSVLFTILPLAVIAVLGPLLLGPAGWLATIGALAVFAGIVVWYPRARYERWRWRMTELALELSYGVLVRRHAAVPYFRIQQIDIARGPIDRLLDLASIEVTTASASGSATLPGIPVGHAPRVRAELLARAADALAGHDGEFSDAV